MTSYEQGFDTEYFTQTMFSVCNLLCSVGKELNRLLHKWSALTKIILLKGRLKMNEELAKRAAKWWTDKLRSPAKLDQGVRSLKGIETLALGSIFQALSETLSDETISKFEKELTKILCEDKDKYPYISTDYHPDDKLQQACDKAGFDPGTTRFPWKTSMWIENGKITVREGYGAEIVEVLP